MVRYSGVLGVEEPHQSIPNLVKLYCVTILSGELDGLPEQAFYLRIGNNEITVLVNDAEKGSDIDAQEAQQALEIAEANLRKAEGKRNN
ncbi:UNVERIFIED_CONTAM: ATP synthase epsilon chain, chloroplastic [Sesamum calycinum]|uniref:ATP synthase epsilon chain, chloroplastic n=1 Tax=Sesamum calycinum TaxID=2727403 RepID=A0AAW2PR69_9LAMI